MLFPQVMPCHMPFLKLILHLTLTALIFANRSQNNVCPKYVGGIKQPIKMPDGTAVNPNN